MNSEHITLSADAATSEPANVERVTLQTGAYQEPKRLPFGCVEQRKFEQRAEHVRQVDENGVHVVFGNGANEVMRVIKPHRRDRNGGVWFLNAETGDGFGGPFNYGDYFPNAHVHPIFADGRHPIRKHAPGSYRMTLDDQRFAQFVKGRFTSSTKWGDEWRRDSSGRHWAVEIRRTLTGELLCYAGVHPTLRAAATEARGLYGSVSSSKELPK